MPQPPKPVHDAGKPDFLCIGAPKSATTWLYMQFAQHPQAWVPPIKELNFLNINRSFFLSLLFPRNQHETRLRSKFKKHMSETLSLIRSNKKNHFFWYCRYYFGRHSMRWYQSLFPATEKLCGEFSTNYATVSSEKIQRIALVLPRLKIIYLLRNPILRTWSHAKMALVRHTQKSFNDIDDLAYYDFFDTPKTQATNDYCGNLAHWQTYIPASQIYIGFYDQIVENSASFLQDLLGFLGLEFDPNLYRLDQLARIPNRGLKKDIPPEFAQYLSKMYLPSIEEMYRRWPNQYVSAWLEDAKLHAGE